MFNNGAIQVNDLSASIDGFYTITVHGSYFITGTFTFQVETCYLVIQFDKEIVILIKPTYANNIFSALVQVYKKENQLSTKNWQISLTLNPYGNLKGIENFITEPGSVLFKNLQIEAIGNFNLQASGFDLITGYSKEVNINYCYLNISVVGDHVNYI